MNTEKLDLEKIRKYTIEMVDAIISFIEDHKEITCIPRNYMTTHIRETYKNKEALSNPQNTDPSYLIAIGVNTILPLIYVFTEAYFFHLENQSAFIDGAIRAMQYWTDKITGTSHFKDDIPKENQDELLSIVSILTNKGLLPKLINGIKHGASLPYRGIEQLQLAQNRLTENSKSNEALIETHRNKLDEQEKKLSSLAQQTGFVELNEAFSSLIREKKKELKVIYWVLASFAALSICTPILIYWLLNTNQYPLEINTSATYLHFAPLFAVELILIYFFRIALGRFNGVKAQLLQIGLRQTLCQFIEKYVDFNEKNKEKASGALEKLELLLFSNIMPTEDKVPSVLDGLESIANLIKNKK